MKSCRGNWIFCSTNVVAPIVELSNVVSSFHNWFWNTRIPFVHVDGLTFSSTIKEGSSYSNPLLMDFPIIIAPINVTLSDTWKIFASLDPMKFQVDRKLSYLVLNQPTWTRIKTRHPWSFLTLSKIYESYVSNIRIFLVFHDTFKLINLTKYLEMRDNKFYRIK